MNGNQLNIACQQIKDATTLNLRNYNLYSLEGIQYFINLKNLFCGENKLKTLPLLPDKLESLNCNLNALTSLPPLPKTLCSLECKDNKLTVLPTLPQTLICFLDCSNNELTNLPELPFNLQHLDCSSNKISCLPALPAATKTLSLKGNPFTCIPNRTGYMDSTLLTFPICKNGDTINNPNGCLRAEGIRGIVFKDDNKDCQKALSETVLKNVPVKLYDASNRLIRATYTADDGTYQFVVPPGNYRTEVDTVRLPFYVSCKADSTVVLSDSLPRREGVNFGVICSTGYDIAVLSATPKSTAFPGNTHELVVVAGNINQLYNLNCAIGDSGKVEVNFTGPVTYAGVLPGALVPVVSGNKLLYNNIKFGSINITKAFQLLFKVNTTALQGDQICVDVTTESFVSDNNSANNQLNFCYSVINSQEPDRKDVYPVNFVREEYDGWFTYTIHFQNTGNLSAVNSLINDSLDPHLDLETFQQLNSSHSVRTSVTGNVLRFNFDNIQLPDSSTNPEGSKGFIQYRIRSKSQLPAGTTVSNKAYIYFDNNLPLITNTTVNHYVKTVSIDKHPLSGDVRIYPNPGTGIFFLEVLEEYGQSKYEIEIYNLFGSLICRSQVVGQLHPIDLSDQPAGTYFIRWYGNDVLYHFRLIKQ